MKKILFVFHLICLINFACAQDEDTDILPTTDLSYTSHYPKLDMAPFTIKYTLEKPFGYIATSDTAYYILLKGKKCWISIPLQVEGAIMVDSIKRVNLNDQGNDELVFSTYSYYDQETGGTLDHEEDEVNKVYVYDLDNKVLLLDIVSNRSYKKVNTFVIDSNGAAVDMHALVFEPLAKEGITPVQRDSLNAIFDEYKETLDQDTQVKYIQTRMTYLLEKNKITLNNVTESKDFFNENPVIHNSRMVYVWLDGEWRLMK